MTPLQLAKIELAAAKQERLKIANSLRAMANEGRERAQKEGKNPNMCDILDHIADAIEKEEL